METFQDVFIGTVDILGYSNLEKGLERLGIGPAEAFVTRMFEFLDKNVDKFRDNTRIVWLRYGDGYVFYSRERAIDDLSEMVKNSCMLLALSLNESIPLRIAITQNTVNVDNDKNGTTFSGKGWEVLRRIEKSLDWMGGFLYLPNYDGYHHDTVQRMIQTIRLVKTQNIVEGARFVPPFKKDFDFSTEKTWFINWHKCLNQPKSTLDQCIENWWSQYAPGDANKPTEDARRKQKNTIDFANYCRGLRQAANLLYLADIDKAIDIGRINYSC